MLILLVMLMVVFFSFQSLFLRLYSIHYAGADAAQSRPVFSICYGMFIAAASLMANGFSFSPSWQTWLLGLVNAGALLLYNISMLEAGDRGSYSFLMIASMFGGILVPLAAGLLFLEEYLRPLQVFAVVLMLISLVVMNLKGISLKESSGAYYLWCALLFLSNGLYGTVMNLQTRMMRGAERAEMLTILFFASALAAALGEALQKRGRQLAGGFRMGRRAALFLLFCCISATVAANLLLYVLPMMNSSVLYTVDNGGVLVLSICYSVILFHEKPQKMQLLGMALAVLSIILIEL